MSTSREITTNLLEDGAAARAHFEVWWTLRNLAIPHFLPLMNDLAHVDFFHASNSGHYKLIFFSLARIFDRDDRVSGVRELKRSLEAEGLYELVADIDKELQRHNEVIGRVMAIRSKTIAHNERAIPRENVYELNEVTPDQLRALIDSACLVINNVAVALGLSTQISEHGRLEQATLRLLEVLERGAQQGVAADGSRPAGEPRR